MKRRTPRRTRMSGVSWIGELQMSEQNLLISKVVVGVIVFVLSILGLLIFLLKGYLSAIKEAITSNRDEINSLRKTVAVLDAEVDSLKMIGMLINGDKTIVQRTLMPRRNTE